MKKVSLVLAIAASAFGGIAGIHSIGKQSEPGAAVAAIHCDMAFDIPDLAKSKTGVKVKPGITVRTNPASAAAPFQVVMAAPYATLPFKKTCAGGNPLDVTWEARVGTQHVDDAWFLNSSTTNTSMLSYEDPMGLRTWTGVADPATAGGDVTFNRFQLEVRLDSRISLAAGDLLPDGSYNMVISLEKYAFPNPDNQDYGPYSGVPVTIQTSCTGVSGPWTNLAVRTSDTAGRIEAVANRAATCGANGTLFLQGVWADAPTVWGKAARPSLNSARRSGFLC